MLNYAKLCNSINAGLEALVKKNSEVPSYALKFVAKLINSLNLSKSCHL